MWRGSANPYCAPACTYANGPTTHPAHILPAGVWLPLTQRLTAAIARARSFHSARPPAPTHQCVTVTGPAIRRDTANGAFTQHPARVAKAAGYDECAHYVERSTR